MPHANEGAMLRLKPMMDRARVWGAWLGLALVAAVVTPLGSFLGPLRSQLLPVAVVALGGFVINSLQNIERALANTSPLARDLENTGLRRITGSAALWAPPAEFKNLTAVGMRVRFVQDKTFLDQCEDVLRRQGAVTLVMADPRSPQVQARYRDEPLPAPYGREIVGEANQMANLANLLSIAHGWAAGLKPVLRKRLTLKVFQHYPNAAYYKVDDEVCTYSYPYRLRGSDAPVYHYSADSKTGRHLMSCLEKVVQSALVFDTAQFEDLKEWQASGRLNDTALLVLPSRPGA